MPFESLLIHNDRLLAFWVVQRLDADFVSLKNFLSQKNFDEKDFIFYDKTVNIYFSSTRITHCVTSL